VGFDPKKDLIVQDVRPESRVMTELRSAGIRKDILYRIIVTGNPAIDALRYITGLPCPPEVDRLLGQMGVGADAGGRQLVLVTAHRRENFGQPLEDICHALRSLAESYPQRLALLYAVHLNPNVQEPVHRLLGGVPNITLTPPQDYLPMAHLLRRAHLVLTDSGGIQEEATSLGKPTLVLREVTERPEGVEAGVLKLVGTDTTRILTEARRLLEDESAYRAMSQAANPFGDGHAAERIVKALVES
jgi:UDP-N-acetylglucosamine 2-epimerase (non-hydrolysing)